MLGFTVPSCAHRLVRSSAGGTSRGLADLAVGAAGGMLSRNGVPPHQKPSTADPVALSTQGGEPSKLPEQGYEGEHVEHKNMQTVTGNWTEEYGPTTAPARAPETPPAAPSPAPDAQSIKSACWRGTTAATLVVLAVTTLASLVE